MENSRIDLGEGFNRLCHARHGWLLINRHDNILGTSIATYGEWSEHEVTLFAQLLEPGGVVIEAGGNIGAHTLPLAKQVGKQGRIYSFEPQRLVFQTLCANMALNSLTNVECFQAAVSDVEGSLPIPDINYEVENNFGGIRIERFTQGIEVPQVTIDGFLKLQKLALIKADIEGMEHKLLTGARETIHRFRPALYLENDLGTPSCEPLIAQVMEMGYACHWHIPRLFNPDNFARNPDNIFRTMASFNMLCLPEEKAGLADALATTPALVPIRTPQDKPF